MADITDDLEAVRLDQTDLLKISAKPVTVQVRKPARDQWFRRSNLIRQRPEANR